MTPGLRPGSLKRACPIILIVAVTWIANFLHFTAFGFYEDDWYYFASTYLYTFRSWFGMLKDELIHFHLGRPLQDTSLRIFGYIGMTLSSIPVLYLFAFALISLSAILLYRVLRVRFPIPFSVTATLIFVLSPLSTIKQFLNYAFTIGPGFILLFLAILSYSRRRLLSLALAVAALLTYESLFFVYFAAPLFRRGKLSKQRLKDLLVHLAVCLGALAGYIVVRRYFAEARITRESSEPLSVLLSTLRYSAFFTISSFKSYFYAAYLGLREAGPESLFYCLLFFVPALTLAFSLWPARRGGYSAARRKRWLRTAAAGLLLTALGYSLAYFHLGHEPDFPLSGRDTRVSGAASIGSSMMAAAVLAWIGESRSRPLRMGSQVLTTICLSFLFLYSFVIQGDYVKEWASQRSFLTQAMVLSPDVRSDSYFIVRTNWIMPPLFPRDRRRPSIGFSRHGLQVSMKSLFGWNIGPRIFFVYSDEWSKYLKLRSDQKLYWTRESFPGGWERSTTDPLTPGSIILMREDEGGVLTRIDTPLWIGGRQIVQVHAETGGKPESNWPFLRGSRLLKEVIPDFVMSAAMSNLTDVPLQPHVRIASSLSLNAIVPAGEGGRLEPGPPLKITTATNHGYFAAAFPIPAPENLFGARYAFVRARVLNGRIGIGLVDARTLMIIRKTVDPSPVPTDIYLPIVQADPADRLVIYNAAEGGLRSEIAIEDVALVVSAAPAEARQHGEISKQK